MMDELGLTAPPTPDRRPTAQQKRSVAERAHGRGEYCLAPAAPGYPRSGCLAALLSPEPFAVDDLNALHRGLHARGANPGEFGIDAWGGRHYRTFFLREAENGYCCRFTTRRRRTGHDGPSRRRTRQAPAASDVPHPLPAHPILPPLTNLAHTAHLTQAARKNGVGRGQRELPATSPLAPIRRPLIALRVAD